MGRCCLFLPPLVLLLVIVGATHAEEVVPPPDNARSLEVVDDGAPVMRSFEPGAPRRGTVREGARLSFVKRLSAPSCARGTGFQIGSEAYLCEEYVRYSADRPGTEGLPRVEKGALLPYEYAFVRFDATRAYAQPGDYFADQYVEAMGVGFGLVVTGRTVYEGIPFARTSRGLWVEEASLRPVSGSRFSGVVLGSGEPLDHAWVLRDDAPVRDRPRGRVLRRESRRTVLRARSVKGHWVELSDGGFMDDRHLARATLSEHPEGVGPHERWIDVDVAEQVLVAYEGAEPRFVTLVSTGRGGPSRATPEGVFRVWAKLSESDMDDLERTDVSANYSMEKVPWVQYFEGGHGLHAAFWHDSFGDRRSHGCVNLSPRDARFVFDFTRPALPPGWIAVLPGAVDRATAIRVR